LEELIEPYTEVVCDLGEGPLWSEAAGLIHWHDVTQRKLYRKSEGGEVEQCDLPMMPGAFALRQRGGLIGAFRNQLAFFDMDSGDLTPIRGHDIDFATERFNDGAVDARGRFWAGTFDPSLKTATGSLYRIDPDLSVHRMDSGIAMSNGIAWSPEGKVMYYSDSRPGLVYRYNFDVETGSIGPREIFIDYVTREGRPDGCTVDSSGNLWVAEVTAGQVSCYSENGVRIRTIRLPVSKPTSVQFGGANYKSLFITSMRYGLSREQIVKEPLAGRLLKIDLDVAGLPETAFAG